MTAALRRILFDATVLSILSMALACGGAASSAAPVATTLASPAEHCLTEAEAKHDRNPSEPDRISVKHILVRYQGAKGAAATIARTREQAFLRAEEALSKLEGGASFAEGASVDSDEPGAATHPADAAPAFADAALALEVKEVSQVVETPFGFHVILRVE